MNVILRLGLTALVCVVSVSRAQDTIVSIDGIVKHVSLGQCDIPEWSSLSNKCKCCLISKYPRLSQGAKASELIEECINAGLCTRQVIEELVKDLKLSQQLILSKESEYHILLQRLHESSVTLKDVPVSVHMLDAHGRLTSDGLKQFLEKAYQQKLLPYPEFKQVSCLQARDVMELKGFKTLQLFEVTSECVPNKQQFIIKEVSTFQELLRLAQSKSITELQPYIYPQKTQDFPVIVFPLAFLQYNDAQGGRHYMIVMPKAQGDNLEAIMKRFIQDPSTQNITAAKNAYYQAGKTMANYHRRFMKDEQRAIAALHGDTQHKNISYDQSNNSIWWIDTEDVITFYNAPGPIAYDIIHILFWSIGITNLLKDGTLAAWIEAVFPAFIEGYASGYPYEEYKKMIKKVIDIIMNYKTIDRYALDPWYIKNYMPQAAKTLQALKQRYGIL